ncbi:MAG: prolyl oligopeptidase family serine peptidase [Bacteroidetes bacterium]|nr:prolyl oligopeptidase family serine peptidase [Bacteroidota bacterium]
MDGNNPVLLYGYGGFGKSMEPFLIPPILFCLITVVFFATPCLRRREFPGWHGKGMRFNKQNTFDDFIAAAEYLINEKYTNPSKLAAMGGLTVGL